ncbi:2801_t:CDS:2 [Funneliformis mosseae]|uniref:2801_t:CDS:1 n=1 Tax=Funneliformis mosseae TaxID=27381 RepID=A0A9N9D580_FUNMO|nr:2801_t:CDS:2 [Funneliformis mosseae]
MKTSYKAELIEKNNRKIILRLTNNLMFVTLNHPSTSTYPTLDIFSMENNNVLDSLSHSNVESNHPNPNFYFHINQIDANIQRIKELTTIQSIERYQNTDQLDLLLNSDRQKSLDMSSQTNQYEQPAYFAVDNDTAQWHSDNDTHDNNIYSYHSGRNALFNNNIPKPNQTLFSYETIDPCLFNIEYEENRYHSSLYSESIFRPWVNSDSPSIQQEIRSIPMDIHHLSSNNLNVQENDTINNIDEVNNKRSSPFCVSYLKRLPSLLKSSQPHLQQSTYFHELCYDDNHNDYSWIDHSLGPIQNENAQQTLPFYCLEDKVIISSNPPQSETSLHFTTNNYLKQVPSRKRAIQADISPEISFNASNNSNHSISQRTKTFEIQDDFIPETPQPSVDLSNSRSDAQPRRQKLRYPGDMYTPQWVRYSGHAKEGYCDNCKPGKWLQLRNSAFWYHKQFFHGISSVSGKTFVSPIETRKFDDDCIEGLCHQCGQWVPIAATRKKNSMLWFRHAHKCHVHIRPKSCPPCVKNAKGN